MEEMHRARYRVAQRFYAFSEHTTFPEFPYLINLDYLLNAVFGGFMKVSHTARLGKPGHQ